MLQLRPYTPNDAETITKWIKDQRSFHQWSADCFPNYPLTPTQMNDHYNKEKANQFFHPMTAFDDTGIKGHFIMRCPHKDNPEEIRLGFVIIDNKERGKGYGKEMLSLAIQYAFQVLKGNKISLAVFLNNPSAIKCYESCGFKPITREQPESYQCMGETWNCLSMELKNKN